MPPLTVYERSYLLDEGQLSVSVAREKEKYIITLLTDIPGPLILHWGAAHNSRREWVLPQPSLQPAGTSIFGNAAAQTPFEDSEGFRRLRVEIAEPEAPQGIPFVLTQSDSGRWIKDKGQNFFIPVALPLTRLSSVADEIIENETGRNSWTLMHRFNLCYDLLEEIGSNNVDAIALIYVWLRFSYIRQLDWQRNYNTKPRELGHAIGRLTYKLAGRYINEPSEREFIRLIMTTLGPGRGAQRVRDEVLNIMHRRRIKEIAGHFMEEWHQKLHNNATPDDIVICEAYLEFLRNNGDIDLFYEKLEEGGITRKRLESYERPIVSRPDFIPHLKNALIHDFEYFLEVLKEVHAGTDLGAAIRTSSHLFDADMKDIMDYVWDHRDAGRKEGLDRTLVLLEKIIEARRMVCGRLDEDRSWVRDLLFLDLALEDFFRTVVERNLHLDMKEDQSAALSVMSLENLCLSAPNEEFTSSLSYWNRLMKSSNSGRLWPLRAKAVVDRLQLSLGNFIDRYYNLLQPKAEFLGKAFHAESWAVNLFTEEVVRGRPAFVLSMLLRKFDPVLRKNAGLGNWQVVSPVKGDNKGVIEIVPDLKSIQGRKFSSPAIIIAAAIEGNEEIPEGVIALITHVSIDVLSHLAVRARNANILFAVCYDDDVIDKLKALRGSRIKLGIGSTGDVAYEESGEEFIAQVQHVMPAHMTAPPKPVFKAYAIPMDEFSAEDTGGKSNNLRRMLGKLPGWICLPASAALPFGVFEKVLSSPANKETAERHDELVRLLSEKADGPYTGLLDEIKGAILALHAPDDLFSSLCAAMEKAGIGPPGEWPEKWEDAWTCIKRVWGSKWNERAYLSRRANGIPHDYLLMAVLIQRIVDADYSFVIHTVNPFTNDRDEVYAEAVPGLGEALAANYPGRALSFTCRKGEDEPRLLSFPAKRICLHSSGLVFRSDSNGEDLADYAGAGLYDSFMFPEPVKTVLNYAEEALVWDDNFRSEFLAKIASVGAAVEKAFGSPQDIEGAYCNGQYYVVQSRPQAGLGND